MRRHREWPLVFFTVLTQLAVGIFVLWGVLAVIFPNYGSDSSLGNRSQAVMITALGALIAGGLAASFHLGRPAGAFFSLSHWQQSWLSREALFSFGFGADVALVLLLNNLEVGGVVLERAAVIAGIILGLGLVAAISRLYQLRTVPAWNHPGTPVMFFTTTFLTGAATLMMILLLSGHAAVQDVSFFGSANYLILMLVLLQAGIFIGTVILIVNQGRTGLESIRLLQTSLRLPLVLRWLFAGAGVIVLFTGSPSLWHVLAYGLLLVSEVLGRFLFYGVYQRSGI